MDLTFACHQVLMTTIKEYLLKIEILSIEIGLPYPEYEKLSELTIRKILRRTLDFEKEILNFKKELTCDIEKDTERVNLLCEQLKLDARVFLPSTQQNCFDSRQFLQKQVSLLSEQKKMAEVEEFKEQQKYFVSLIDLVKKKDLDDTEKNLAEVEPKNLSNIPKDLKILKEYIKKIEELKESNKRTSIELISSIRNVLRVLNLSSEEVEPLVNSSSCDQQILFQMDTVSELQKKLDHYLAIRKSQIKECFLNVRMEIKRLLDGCHFSEEYKLSCREFFTGNTDNEEELSHLEEYLLKLQQVAAKLSSIDDKIRIYGTQWHELDEVEGRLNDPDKFLNRGGRLLKDEALKKKLLHSLPKIEAEIAAEIDLLKNSVDLSLRSDLETFSRDCEERWKNYHDKKNFEVQVRHKNKVESLNHDLRYGTKPAQVSKRHVAGHASKIIDDVKKKAVPLKAHNPMEKPSIFVMERLYPEESIFSVTSNQSKLKNISQEPITSTPSNTTTHPPFQME